MKLILLFTLIVTTIGADAQQDTIFVSNKVYIMELNQTTGTRVTGFVKNMNDSLLYYSTQKSTLGTAISMTDPAVPYSAIQAIRVRRKGAVGRGALIGAGIGFGLGMIIGLASGDDRPGTWFALSAGEKAIALGFAGTIGGGLIGVIAGAISGKSFTINSQKSNFLNLQSFLAKKTKKIVVTY